MQLEKNDFIEVEFTGKVKGGEVFDSNIKKELERLHHEHEHPIEAKPFIFSLGQGMFFKTIDDFLIGKPAKPASYELELKPEQAFGNRNQKLIQMIPMRIFREQKLNPVPGAVFNFDGRIAKILTVSGGRIMADFNHPLAGKEIVYNLNILRKVTDLNEKLKAFIDFLFKQALDFEVSEKKLVIKAEKPLLDYINLFKDKFKEIFDLTLVVEEKSDEKKQKLKKHHNNTYK